MPARALIIAIENYAQDGPLAPLKGVNDAALDFHDWLKTKKKIDVQHVLCCADESVAFRTAGTTRQDIVNQLIQLRNTGVNKTPELYVFISGHGFSFEDPEDRHIDALMGSDVTDLKDHGGRCLNLNEVRLKLKRCLGKGHHFFFIDACRNPLASKLRVGPITESFDPSDRGEARSHALYSTAPGLPTPTAGGFADFLVNGLSGQGRAKGWRGPGKMSVTFQSLIDYVRSKVKNVDDSPGGGGDPEILQIDPIPQADCVVHVVNANTDDTFKLTATVAGALPQQIEFGAAPYRPVLPPNDYVFHVDHPTSIVKRQAPPGDPLDLFEPCEVRFIRIDGTHTLRSLESLESPPPKAVDPQAKLASHLVAVAPSLNHQVSLHSLQTGESVSYSGKLDVNRAPGTYDVSLIEAGAAIDTRRVVLRAGEDITINFLDTARTPLHESILRHLTLKDGLPDFSESLRGPTANFDLGFWLAMLGASRVLGEELLFSKLEHLPLHSFDASSKDDSPVYVLAGLGAKERPWTVTVRNPAGAVLLQQPMTAVPTLAGVFEAVLPAPAGSCLVSFAPAEGQAITLASYCLPNRATFITLHHGPAGTTLFHQYLLPIRRLFKYLPPKVLEYLEYNLLSAVRSIFQAQQHFAGRESLAQSLRAEWNDMLHNKWLDPMMCLMAAYDMLRGGLTTHERQAIQTVIYNLRKYFPGIPDTEAIAKMAREYKDATRPVGPPLLLDGYLALAGGETQNDTSEMATLDYRSPWTRWRGVPEKQEWKELQYE